MRQPGAPHIRVPCECVSAACVIAVMDCDPRGTIVQRSERPSLIVIPTHSSRGGWPRLLTSLAPKTKWVPRPLRTWQRAGTWERMRDWVAEPQRLCRQDRYPPLQKTQGRGTLSIDGAHRRHQKGGPPATRVVFARWSRLHPCQNTHSGQPSRVVIVWKRLRGYLVNRETGRTRGLHRYIRSRRLDAVLILSLKRQG